MLKVKVRIVSTCLYRLLPAFNTVTGVPLSLVNMRTGAAKSFPWTPGGASILSDLGSLTMEFSYLSDLTGNPVYRWEPAGNLIKTLTKYSCLVGRL